MCDGLFWFWALATKLKHKGMPDIRAFFEFLLKKYPQNTTDSHHQFSTLKKDEVFSSSLKRKIYLPLCSQIKDWKKDHKSEICGFTKSRVTERIKTFLLRNLRISCVLQLSCHWVEFHKQLFRFRFECSLYCMINVAASVEETWVKDFKCIFVVEDSTNRAKNHICGSRNPHVTQNAVFESMEAVEWTVSHFELKSPWKSSLVLHLVFLC